MRERETERETDMVVERERARQTCWRKMETDRQAWWWRERETDMVVERE